MQEELLKNQEEHYKFDLHQQQFEHTREQISKGLEILSETKNWNRRKMNLYRNGISRHEKWILYNVKYLNWRAYLFR